VTLGLVRVIQGVRISPLKGIKMNTQTKDIEQSSQNSSLENSIGSSGSTRKLMGSVKSHTKKRFAAEEKIRIVLEGFSRELPVSDLCRRESISTAIYYSWLKTFMEAGKSRLQGDFKREANAREVSKLKKENSRLKEVLAEVTLEKELFKKSLKA